MPSVVQVVAVYMSVCRWGVADGRVGMVDVMLPASTFAVGVCLVLNWVFSVVDIGVLLFWGELRLLIPGGVVLDFGSGVRRWIQSLSRGGWILFQHGCCLRKRR